MAHRPDYESADYKEGYEDGKREASKQWVGLSDNEKTFLAEYSYTSKQNLIDEVEQALKEKNE